MTPSDLVTDAMVEAACVSRYGEFWTELSADSQDFAREDMRDAIEAALAASPLPVAVEALYLTEAYLDAPSAIHQCVRHSIRSIEEQRA